MCKVFVFMSILSAFAVMDTNTEYADSNSNNVGKGTGFGYGGSFSNAGSGGNGNIPVPGIPNFAGGDFSGFFDSLQKYHQQFINDLQNQVLKAQQQQAQGFVETQSRFGEGAASPGGGYAGGFSGNGGGAAASASIGPGGGFQSAAVYPENPNKPNIFTRFGAPAGGNGDGQSYGVFTSSVSSSSNLNGKPQTSHQASTTINDNGKVSTYTVKNP